jgi:hypothetical protein
MFDDTGILPTFERQESSGTHSFGLHTFSLSVDDNMAGIMTATTQREEVLPTMVLQWNQTEVSFL